MKVACRVDLRAVDRAVVEATRDLRAFPAAMEARLNQAAQDERSSHRYRNQTGHLEQSTKAGLISQTEDELVIDLEMGEPYASFVIGRGFSAFPTIVDEATRDIEVMQRKVEERIGRR